jgi:FHS family L-fucose permease-like MFS transporter
MNQSEKKHQSYVLPIAIMFALFFMIAFVTGYQNPLGVVIEKLSNGNPLFSQLGTLANFIAYAFMGYPAGILLQNKGFRVTALTAVSVGFIGVLVTYLSGFIVDPTTAVTIYLIGAFVSGFSMCLLNTVVNPMLNSLGSTPNKGNQLVQFGGSFNSLGATLAPVIVGGLIGANVDKISSADPVFYMAMAIFFVAFLVIFFSRLPESPDLGKPRSKVKASGAFAYRNFTFGVIAIFCYVGIEVGIANWTLQYLTKSEGVVTNNVGFEATAIAGTVVGIYWLLMLVGRLLGGLVGNKVSSRAMLTVASAGAMVLVILGIYTAENFVDFIGFSSSSLSFSVVSIPLNAIFLVLCGLFASIMWGAIFNLSVTGLGKYTAVASGIFMVMVCGGGILPAIQSFIAAHDILSSFWLVFGLLGYLLVYALVLSRPNKKGAPEILVED